MNVPSLSVVERYGIVLGEDTAAIGGLGIQHEARWKVAVGRIGAGDGLPVVGRRIDASEMRVLHAEARFPEVERALDLLLVGSVLPHDLIEIPSCLIGGEVPISHGATPSDAVVG